MIVTHALNAPESKLYDITDAVKSAVSDSGVTDGLAVVFVPHTTAAVSIVSFPDPLTLEDVRLEIDRLIPTRVDFLHQHDTPPDAAGHIKSAIVGSSLTVIVENGELLLGHSQAIYFFEFDAPREREVKIKVVAA